MVVDFGVTIFLVMLLQNRVIGMVLVLTRITGNHGYLQNG